MTIPERLLREPLQSPARVLAVRQYAAGSKLADLWQQVQDWRARSGHHPIAASYATNQWFDDFYRTMVSVDKWDSLQRTGGKQARLAEVEAINLVRNTMQNWDQLLPIERQIMRTVFPFYSFARFSVGFVARYPASHPLRAAVMAQFARNELEDMGSALPDQFAGLFQLNAMDDDGNAMFLRTMGLNPFEDAVDWFTLDGLVGNVNPLISATLQSLGVNPAQGGPMLYPTLKYDPETGGLTADTPGFAKGVVTSLVPQTRLVDDLILGNREFGELSLRNPRAAGSRLLSEFGLPVLVEQRNIPEEIFRAETNRLRSRNQAESSAFESGDLSKLDAYPALKAYVAQRLALTSETGVDPETGEPVGNLDTTVGPSDIAALIRAVIGGFP